MRWRLYAHIAIFSLLLGGCITQPPLWRAETKLLLDRAQLNEAAQLLPDEYASVVKTFDSADVLFQRGLFAEADLEFRQAWTYGRVLENKLYLEQVKRSEDAQVRAEFELLQVARERAIFEDERRLNWEEQLNQAANASADATHDDADQEPKQRPLKEAPAVTSYTVRRGESLPQIASRAEVYADSQLWPLLYRSNRDQISDPRRIWPGQVLRVPRNLNAEELAEARRFAQKSTYF